MVSYSHFVVEGPATVLAAVELALLVDGVLYQVKRRLPSAFGAADSLALLFFYRILYHLFKLDLSRNERPFGKGVVIR